MDRYSLILNAPRRHVGSAFTPLAIPASPLAMFSMRRDATRTYCMRVRRASDNATLDVGWAGNWVDAQAIIDWAAGAAVYVNRLYSLNAANDWVQADTSKQPLLLAAGAVPQSVRYSGAVRFTNALMSTPSVAWGQSVTALAAVYNSLANGGVAVGSGSATDGTQENWYAPLDSGAGQFRVGIAKATPSHFNLWDRTLTAPVVVGAKIVLTNGPSTLVIPIVNSTVGTSGWTQSFSSSGGTFSNEPCHIGADGRSSPPYSNVLLRGAGVYGSALSDPDVHSVAKFLGAYPSGIIIGDSTIAAYSGTTEVAAYVHNSADMLRSDGIVSIAVPGHTIAQQKAQWQATTNRQYVDWVIIEIGLNDTNPAVSAATTVAALQDLVNTVRADNSTCKILIATMTPAWNRWPAVGYDPPSAQAKWVAMNEAISGGGATPVTGVDGRITSHTASLTELVSGNAALAGAYDTGDHIHENNAGRQIIGAAYRAAIAGVGLL